MSKIALITGANRGLGLETARQLAQLGFAVIIGARDVAKGEAAAAQLRAAGFEASAIWLDVANEISIENAAREIGEKFGHLDVLINNAGVQLETSESAQPPSRLAPAVLRATFETNFIGAFLVLQSFVPLLLKSAAPRVVNVSSTLGSLGEQSNVNSPFYGMNAIAYNGSKSALNALTIAFAKEFAETPLKINSACPGWVKTDLGGEQAPRKLEEGPRIFVKLATLPANGPTGQFFDENGTVAW